MQILQSLLHLVDHVSCRDWCSLLLNEGISRQDLIEFLSGVIDLLHNLEFESMITAGETLSD